MDKWTEVFVEMNAVTGTASEDVTASDARGGGMAGRLLVANRLAASLTRLCDRLDAIVETYSEQMQSADVGMSALIEIIENDPTDRQVNYLETAARGDFLLLAGPNRVPVHIMVPPWMDELIVKSRGH